eukprot:TRINITY_DN56497_c0_g1_i1.p1 TRINITY_DN56497_c0_g1~~TRINITY_DN56497_c0_g1_i1.p1  ORF type:complete len:797 (-),score=230.83 TRINITY_DN56497_c0_g1_i1:141-2480(-)
MVRAAAPGLLLALISLDCVFAAKYGHGASRAFLAVTTPDNPVKRVVKLLQEMKMQLEKDVAADKGTYEKMVCWCKTNERAKTEAVAEAEAKISELEEIVEGASAHAAGLATKAEHLQAEIEERKQALREAIAIREKELSEFNTHEKEMVEAVTMLKNAIEVLGRHNADLLQMTPALRESIGAALRWASLKREELVEFGLAGGRSTMQSQQGVSLLAVDAGGQAASGRVAQSEALAAALAVDARTLAAFRSSAGLPAEFAARVLARAVSVAAPAAAASLAQQPAHLRSYDAQSGQIFGVLGQMKDEFEANLNQAQKAELAKRDAFVQLKKAADTELESSTARLDAVQEEHSATVKALADAKEDLAATREARGADVAFLRDLKVKCNDLDHQWASRSKARGEELRAVADAIAIITEEDSRDLFSEKLSGASSPSFLQRWHSVGRQAVAVQRQTALRRRTAAALLQAAQRLGTQSAQWRAGELRPHEQLAAVAAQVQLDAFSTVKKAINEMVQELESQQADEVKRKDYCNGELRSNEKERFSTKKSLAELDTKIKALSDTIRGYEDDIAAAKNAIARTEVELKVAGEAREQENKQFQAEVMDQRAIQNILNKAVARLRAVYKANGGSGLVQEPATPPEQFQPYQQHAGAAGVVSMLEAIVADSAAVEKEALQGESEAQKTYETFAADAGAMLKALKETIATKSDASTEAAAAKGRAEAEAKSTSAQLEDLRQYDDDLHMQCDFLLNNFDVRQKARRQEVEALQGARATLSGMLGVGESSSDA